MLEGHGGVDGIIKKLASDANSGIIGDERDLERRAKMFGENTMPHPPYANWAASLFDTIKDRMWWFAIGTAILAMIGGWIKAGAISGTRDGLGLLMFCVVIIAIITTVDYIKDSRFVQLLQLLHDENMSVIRGKAFQTRSISVWDMVVGDVVLLENGSRVPADCLVIDSENVRFDEPDQDGADGAVSEGDARTNDDVFVRAGSIVKSGNAKVIVCVVGEASTRGTNEKKVNLSAETVLE
jgi:Ca2+-transporting ATPase